MDTQNNSEGSSKKAWIIGGIVVVLVIIGFSMYNRSRPVATPSQEITAVDQNSITVSDQDPDSVAALIDSVSVKESSFVIIHDDANGKPGAIVGVSKLLAPGTYTNLSIIMPMKPGATYYAMMHADDGNGVYDKTADSHHLMDNAGVEARVMFKVKLSSPGSDSKG